jgi:hypothetical protein
VGDRDEGESQKAYKKRATQYWIEQWKEAAEDSLQTYKGLKSETGYFRWDIRRQKLEEIHEKKAVTISRDRALNRLRILWSYILSLPAKALSKKMRQLLEDNREENGYITFNDEFFDDQAWIPKQVLKGGECVFPETETLFKPYDLEGMTTNWCSDLRKCILDVFGSRGLMVSSFKSEFPEQVWNCWKSFNFSPDEMGEEAVCLTKGNQVIAAVLLEVWSDSLDSNMYTCVEKEDTLYMKACGALVCEDERLAYLLQLYLLLQNSEDSFRHVIARIPQAQGCPNFSAMADMAHLFGYKRCFGKDVLSSLPASYPKVHLSPESLDSFNMDLDPMWNIEPNSMFVSAKAKEQARLAKKQYFMARKYPSKSEMLGTFYVLHWLLKDSANNLINGFYDGDGLSVKSYNGSSTMTTFELKAAKLLSNK